MKKMLFVCAAAAAMAAAAHAANEQIMVSYEAVMNSADAKAHLDDSIKLMFGPNSKPAHAKSLGNITINKIAKGSNRKDFEGACNKAVAESLAELQQKAKSAGADGAANIVSSYKGIDNVNATQAECHAGGTGGHLTLKAELIKLK